MLTPVSGSSSTSATACDKYAVFKQLSVDQSAESSASASGTVYASTAMLESVKEEFLSYSQGKLHLCSNEPTAECIDWSFLCWWANTNTISEGPDVFP